MKKLELIFLSLILLGAFLTRLYMFHRPIADWHSWRQVDTSAVSRNFVKEGFDIFYPKFDDLSMGVSLLDNPRGYRFVEFPIYNVAQAGLFKFFGHFTLEEWGRLVTIFSQLVSIVFVFLLVKLFSGGRTGLIAAAFFAFIPFNVFYGRTILPDSSMVAALLSSIYFFARWIEKEKISFFILSLFSFTIALLLKPYALFFTLPFAAMVFEKFGLLSSLKNKKLWAFAIVSVLPFALWRWWMGHFPEGIPQSNWLFNGTGIRFKGAYFQWIYADRIGRLILGYYGLAFVLLGIALKQKKEGLIYFAFLASSIIYLAVMATGNVQHDYYQILIIPTLAIFFAKGVDFLLSKKEVINRFAAYGVLTVSVAFMLAFSWFLVRDYYNLNHVEVYQVGVIADNLLPKNVKVVAPYGGDTTFLYYVNRKGWPVVDRSFKELVQSGAHYIIFAKPTPSDIHLDTLYPVFAKGTTDSGADYIIFDLTKPLTPGKY